MKDAKGRVVYATNSGACYVKQKKADGTFGMRKHTFEKVFPSPPKSRDEFLRDRGCPWNEATCANAATTV